MTRPSFRVEQEIPDQPEVERLFAAADAGRTPGPSPEDLLRADVRFFVARRNGEAVGCCGYVPGPGGTALLRRLVLRADAQDDGLAAALVAAAAALARLERLEPAFGAES